MAINFEYFRVRKYSRGRPNEAASFYFEKEREKKGKGEKEGAEDIEKDAIMIDEG